jgi:hypothetical protein
MEEQYNLSNILIFDNRILTQKNFTKKNYQKLFKNPE